MSNLFINSALITIEEVKQILRERGEQYSDTWGKQACWNLTRAIVKELTGQTISEEACRSIALATFVDQKYSRFAGGFKRDTSLDLIGYMAALAEHLDGESATTTKKHENIQQNRIERQTER